MDDDDEDVREALKEILTNQRVMLTALGMLLGGDAVKLDLRQRREKTADLVDRMEANDG